MFAYKIQDDIFKETIGSTNRNIALLKVLILVLYAVGGGIGFLVCFMFIRTRTREFAVMRSLGMKQPSVILLTFGEQAILAAIGAAVAYAAYATVIKGNYLMNGLIFLACYLFGVLALTIWITSVNVMKTLKAED